MTEHEKFIRLMQFVVTVLEDAKMDFMDNDYRSAYAKIATLQHGIQEGLEKEEDDA